MRKANTALLLSGLLSVSNAQTVNGNINAAFGVGRWKPATSSLRTDDLH